ncbi:MAG: VIT1/CCC1 transporter family protein [Verrucomicrobiota bacterium]
MLSSDAKKKLLGYQRDEITEHYIYHRLAAVQKSSENRRVLERIADDEKRHYEQWKAYTGTDVARDQFKIWIYCRIASIFGLTFAVKLMERGEASAQQSYAGLPAEVTEAKFIAREEGAHEDALLAMLDEERLRYVGSIVLGLNDALVELTGALAGLTLALQNTKLIALTGSITGIAAAFSMAASEYISTKTEGGTQNPLKAALYTGTAYILTVILLIMPYLILPNFYAALVCTLMIAVSIIAVFNYYIAVAKNQSFGKHFTEMAGLSLGVAALSFLAGWALRAFLGVDV